MLVLDGLVEFCQADRVQQQLRLTALNKVNLKDRGSPISQPATQKEVNDNGTSGHCSMHKHEIVGIESQLGDPYI